MNPTTFNAVNINAGNRRWRSLFNAFWPAYRSWYESKNPGGINSSELRTARRALNSAMPELMPVYQQLCECVDGDPAAMQFLTMFQPPAYLINCSQAVFLDDQPILIRNYDLSPELSENTLVHSGWQGRKVIATSECLWGADDGINDAGLAVSLTFGGRREVGAGFGIPLIVRYVLQTCETVAQAIAQLKRIPSHMAYNVTVVDPSGDTATVMLIPDRDAIVTRQGVATNHQQAVVWPEQAVFSRTRERKQYLEALLRRDGINERMLVNEFHRAPLYSTKYAQNFGTVYTAVYKTQERTMAYHWPGEKWEHGFDAFNEGGKTVTLGRKVSEFAKSPVVDHHQPGLADTLPDDLFVNDTAGLNAASPPAMAQFETVLSGIPESFVCNRAAYQALRKEIQAGSRMSWERFAGAMQALWVC